MRKTYATDLSKSGLSTRSPTRTAQDREDAYPRPARRLRRHLLRLEEWLPLAVVAWRLPALVYRLLPPPQVPPERPLAPGLRSFVRRRGRGAVRTPTPP